MIMKLYLLPKLCFSVWGESAYILLSHFHMRWCNSWLHPSVRSLCSEWGKKNGNCDSESIAEEKHSEVCFQTLSRSFNVREESRALERRMQVSRAGRGEQSALGKQRRKEEEGSGTSDKAVTILLFLVKVSSLTKQDIVTLLVAVG